MKKIIQAKEDLCVPFHTLAPLPLPTQVLMVTPTYFNIDTPLNAHMLDANGQTHLLDKNKALKQWNELKLSYENLGLKVSIVEGVPNLPDMVFCANQSFPYLDKDNLPSAILSNMRNGTRHAEVEHIKRFLTAQGYYTEILADRSEATFFEGMGDVTWLGRTPFMLGGYGFRTEKGIYEKLVQATQYPLAIFELKNPKFYHLDTCLSVLNSSTALACKEAFTEQGFELLKALFPTLLEVPLREADSPGFACNAHCPDEKHVLIQKGCSTTNALLKEHGFMPIELDTSEFIKSGGSVYCMKLMFY